MMTDKAERYFTRQFLSEESIVVQSADLCPPIWGLQQLDAPSCLYNGLPMCDNDIFRFFTP